MNKLLDEAKKKAAFGALQKGGGRWVTMNGSRIFIGPDGKARKGPAALISKINDEKYISRALSDPKTAEGGLRMLRGVVDRKKQLEVAAQDVSKAVTQGDAQKTAKAVLRMLDSDEDVSVGVVGGKKTARLVMRITSEDGYDETSISPIRIEQFPSGARITIAPQVSGREQVAMAQALKKAGGSVRSIDLSTPYKELPNSPEYGYPTPNSPGKPRMTNTWTSTIVDMGKVPPRENKSAAARKLSAAKKSANPRIRRLSALSSSGDSQARKELARILQRK